MDEQGGGRITTIRDSLYDSIDVRPCEAALLGTRAFLRLDGIKQLGFVARVWPGAKHSRFEHSLGVFALMCRALQAIRPSLEAMLRPQPSDYDAIIGAALLHDIGHYPFSHAIEELGPPVLRHEEVGRAIVEPGEVAAILEDVWGLDPRRVANLIEPREPLAPVDAVLSGLLSGTLDVDKLDYLPRDAKACHVPYGGVDTARLLSSLQIAEVEGAPRIVIGDKGVGALHSLIAARQEMFDNVYWHHTNRACMVMLLRAVQDALLAGAVTPQELTHHDDASLLALLEREDMSISTRSLVERLRLRRLHKRAVEISARAGELYAALDALYYDPARRRAVECRLAARLAAASGAEVADYDVLIDIPKPEKWKTDVWVCFERPPVGMQPLMHWRDVVGLRDEDFKRYEDHRRLIRIVTPEHLRETARAYWDDTLLPALTADTSSST